ncbi:rhodanese-like domain-containing protein [Halobacteria archaeon AArc-dxtr1]|nr:rhodanese-like domain-containing protein [Halobacteria archaeon AArc-dxtr1]
MDTSRRDILRVIGGTSIASVVAGCVSGGSSSDEPNSGDDGPDSDDETDDSGTDNPESGSSGSDDPESTGGSNEDSDALSVELLAESSVGHIHACSHATFDDRTPLAAAGAAADAPTVADTHVIWDVTHEDDYGYVTFDAEAHAHNGAFVFYVAEGVVHTVVGTELERDVVDDDTCEVLDTYVVVAPDEGQIVLGVGDNPDIEIEHPDEYPEGIDESDGDETGDTDENGYETYSVWGTEVPLAPTEDVFQWYEDDEELVVVDTRSEDAYEELRIPGALLSPAPEGVDVDDPLEDVANDARIVTYCVCPHTLAGNRAADLIEDGYTDVYALKEGLQEWVDRGYPVEGTDVE